MGSGPDKWIRSIKDNPAGKVVTDPEGNRWQWEDDDETARLLKALQNDELAIEQTDIVPNPLGGRGPAADPPHARTPFARPLKPSKKLSGRDAGGGFNPYDSPGKPRRR